MQVRLFTRMQPVQFIDGAGHWVQQEHADQVASRLIAFLRRDGAG
jgi:pimeloyl-ACP methyl ester carboxylesterase